MFCFPSVFYLVALLNRRSDYFRIMSLCKKKPDYKQEILFLETRWCCSLIFFFCLHHNFFNVSRILNLQPLKGWIPVGIYDLSNVPTNELSATRVALRITIVFTVQLESIRFHTELELHFHYLFHCWNYVLIIRKLNWKFVFLKNGLID